VKLRTIKNIKYFIKYNYALYLKIKSFYLSEKFLSIHQRKHFFLEEKKYWKRIKSEGKCFWKSSRPNSTWQHLTAMNLLIQPNPMVPFA